MTFLTIFTAPKPFTDPHIDIIQRNAIQSWQNLRADVDVIMAGDEDGMEVVATELGVTHLPQVRCSDWGTPFVSSIFKLARNATDSPYLAYVNADILLLPEFVEITRQVADQSQNFLVVGQRWNLDVTQNLDFSQNWDEHLKTDTLSQGELHRPAGSDYFIFPREIFLDMPDFAIGRAGWDNWMIYQALQQRWPVIDATPDLMIIHQNHDYAHLPGGKPHYDHEETKVNAALGGGMQNMYMTIDTSHELIAGKIRPARWTRDRTLRRLERLFQPENDRDRGLKYKISRRFRRMRRGLV
jgi:hypothetical protein